MTDKQLHLVLFLIVQGYQDDIMNNSSDFAEKAEAMGLPKLIQDCTQHNPDLSDTLSYVLERVEESRELILNISSKSRASSSSSMTTRSSSKARKESAMEIEESEEEVIRKRKAEAAAKRR